MAWTVYAIRHFGKSEPMLHARSSSVKEILLTSKNLALDNKQHEFDMDEMQKT